ncbi:hypothetical protein F2Q69_00004452 [Brassica cretica]|uniref:Uncharacterized protein n=1 Tax=Brassica cretica TaxID=69181 RepID=A0A8S9NPH9_BRACR|nr:hypothetical protein F2Q69_00004452 [Brassica cretica]
MHSFTDFEGHCDLRGDLHGDFSPDPIKGLRSCSVQLKDWLICMNSSSHLAASSSRTLGASSDINLSKSIVYLPPPE